MENIFTIQSINCRYLSEKNIFCDARKNKSQTLTNLHSLVAAREASVTHKN